MIKHFFMLCLIPSALLLSSMEVNGQAKLTPTAAVVKTVVTYTVKNVSGSVTLNGKQLKVGDTVRDSDISKIMVGKNGYFELSGSNGKSTLYGAKCSTPPCQPTSLVTTVTKGPKKEILEGTQAEFDQIMLTFNQVFIDKQTQQLQLDNQQLQMNKQQMQKVSVPQQQKAPQQLNNKARAGGG